MRFDKFLKTFASLCPYWCTGYPHIKFKKNVCHRACTRARMHVVSRLFSSPSWKSVPKVCFHFYECLCIIFRSAQPSRDRTSFRLFYFFSCSACLLPKTFISIYLFRSNVSRKMRFFRRVVRNTPPVWT
jgi:hypothetical protein